MMRSVFEDDEIPYDVLNRFGLSQEMIEDLPQNVLSGIREGRRSPVLPICYTCEDGAKVPDRARFSLFRDEENGKVSVMFYPRQTLVTLDQFNAGEQALLREGKAIICTKTNKDGREVQSFYQLDVETQQVLSVPTPVIGNNLQVLADHFQLNAAELTCLKNGEPLTLVEGEKETTLGIDLNEAKGFRSCPGNAQRWKELAGQALGTYTFGIFGCWVKDDNGDLNYVPESEYTETLWEAQKLIGQSRASAHKM
jgi:hypothetical protein